MAVGNVVRVVDFVSTDCELESWEDVSLRLLDTVEQQDAAVDGDWELVYCSSGGGGGGGGGPTSTRSQAAEALGRIDALAHHLGVESLSLPGRGEYGRAARLVASLGPRSPLTVSDLQLLLLKMQGSK